jgi:rhomboid family GlyGly-CTERM serine protease
MRLRELLGRASRGASASFALGLAAVLVHVVPGLPGALEYQRDAIAHGELFRWLTGHWTHGSACHLFWDAAVLTGVGSACERRSRRGALLCILVAAFTISLALWLSLPQLESYRGLSGIDAALFALLSVGIFLEKLRQREWKWVMLGAAILAGFTAKTVFEASTGTMLFVGGSTGGLHVVPLAHMVGAATGTTMALFNARV